MMVLPAGHVPVDFVVTNNEWDSGTDAMQINAGVMTGSPYDITRDKTKVGAEILPASSTALYAAAQNRLGVTVSGGVTAASSTAFMALTASTSNRSIGFAVTAAANANPSTTRTITLDVWYKAAN
jgi:hypothetical protein